MTAGGESSAPDRQGHGADPRTRIPAIDGVRGVAILIVLLHNLGTILTATESIGVKAMTTALGAGWVGVQLFFVLSGFLVTGILLESLGADRYFRSFYARRTFRIFPLYYLTLLVAFVVVPLFPDAAAWTAKAQGKQVYYWTYSSNWAHPYVGVVPGFGHFWSLAVEEQFYFVWPFVVFFLPLARLRALCVGVVVLGPLVRLTMDAAGLSNWAITEFTIARLDALVAGALLAILMRSEEGRGWMRRCWVAMTAVGVVAGSALLVLNRSYRETDPAILVLGQTPAILLALVLIYVSADSTPGSAASIRRWMSAGWLRGLGKYSYALYVFHWPIFYLLQPSFEPWVNDGASSLRLVRAACFVVIASAVSLALARLSWSLVEAPSLRVKERVAPRPQGASAAPLPLR